MRYETLNPATGETLETFATATAGDIEKALEQAQSAFASWRQTPVQRRAALLTRVATALEQDAEAYGHLMAVEMGKPIAQGAGEAKKCAWVCRYYAENAEDFLSRRPAESDGSDAYIRADPLGPILAIMPWNFPFWQVFRFAAPALVAGNAGILKHSPNTPQCAEAIVALFRDAGAPEGLFQNLFLTNEQAAEVIGHPAIRGVTLTGSTRAGRAVAGAAGHHLKKTVLELGGSDPFLIFADADLEKAVEGAVASRCLNSGQSCIAAKRFLVEESIQEDFLERFTAAMKAQKVGDPLAEGTNLGPLARADLRDTLAEQVERAKAQGARVLAQGEIPEGPGFYYPPTVLTGLDPHQPAAQEEYFGPVATVYPFTTEEDAVRIANGTDYGLGSSLWTRDRDRIERLVGEINAGSVFVNGMVKSDPRLPFGGIKDSGYGRELALDGLAEWVNVKTVWVG
jgi:succinate-semialdehyde dehydrogenase / glutarate-semialdehyde dehydrogenase